MTNFPSSDSQDELLAGYVLGDLTPTEVATIYQLLKTHPELKQEIDALQTTLALLPLALPEALPPPSLRDRLLNKLAENSSQNIRQPSSQLVPSNNSFTWSAGQKIASTIFALTILFMGGYIFHLKRQLILAKGQIQEQQTIINLSHDPNHRFFTLRSIENYQTTSGKLILAPTQKIAVLSINNLASLPPGQFYRLWVFDQGKPMNCGDFSPDQAGQVLWRIPLEAMLMQVEKVAVTIEEDPNISEPAGTMVMVSQDRR